MKLEQTIARLMSLADDAIQHASRGESDNAIWTRNDLEAALRTELSAPAVQPTTLLNQALGALQIATTPLPKDRQEVREAIAAIQAAIAQPAQPKVADYDSLIDSVKRPARKG